MIEFVAMVIKQLNIDNAQSSESSRTRVGLLTFRDTSRIEFNLNRYKDKMQLLHALNFPFTGGKTNTSDAIRYWRKIDFGSILAYIDVREWHLLNS